MVSKKKNHYLCEDGIEKYVPLSKYNELFSFWQSLIPDILLFSPYSTE